MQTLTDGQLAAGRRYVELNIGLVENSENESEEDSDPDFPPTSGSSLSGGKLKLPDDNLVSKRPLIEEVGPQDPL